MAKGGPLEGPMPDIVIASGRKTVANLRALKRMGPGRPFTVFLKDPRTGPGTADFIWAPLHDRISGSNVLKSLTSPHRVTPERLDEARAATPPEIGHLPDPRVAVLIGGDSRHHTFKSSDIDRLFQGLLKVCQAGASLMITTSRRTPESLRTALAFFNEIDTAYLWDGTGENPYLSILANADAVVVTADSVNMAGEAACLGKPVHIFHPSGGTRKITRFLDGLAAEGIATNFDGHLETGERPSLDSTPVIAQAIHERYTAWCRSQGDRQSATKQDGDDD